MAIRVQRGRQRPFFVYWRNPFTGRRESKACATREEAEKLDSLTKYQLQYEREVFRRPEQEQAQPAPTQTVQTLESLLYLYLRDRGQTLDNLARTLTASKAMLETHGDIPVLEITKAHMEEMKNAMLAKGNSPATIRRKLCIVKAALRWAQRNGHIETVPTFPQLPPVRNTRFVPPTPGEVAALYAAAPEHIRRAIVLGYYLGVRVGPSELLKLTWADVDLGAGVVRVPNAHKGNADPWREVPVTPQVAALLAQWQEQDATTGATHIVHVKGNAVKSIKTAWRGAKQRAGITRPLRPYDLRHGFATQIIAGGADVGTVAVLMGHTSPTMVLKHYQHVLDSQKQRAVSALPPLPECVQVCKIDVCKQ